MARIRSSMHLFKSFGKLNSVLRFSKTLSYSRNVFGTSSYGSSISLPFCYRPVQRSIYTTQFCYSTSKSINEHLAFSNSTSSSAIPPSNENESSQKKSKEEELKKRAMKYTFIAFGAIFTGMVGIVVYEWGSPLIDENGNVIEDEFSHLPMVKAYALRSYKEAVNYNKMIKDPSREKLLPEPLTDPYYQPPYTLVLEMTGVLVHPDWTYKTGWRFKKRPGVDYFLQQIGPPLFEVVIFTSEQGFTAYPILDTLDPNGYIMYRLFRDSTRYMDGHHVKDLSCLNRDLSKVIYVDWNPKSFSLQPKNALMVEKWNGEDDDKTLIDLADMLRTIGTSEVQDVRTVLEYYGQFDDKSPVDAFKENRKKLREEEEKRIKETQGSGSVLVSGLLKNIKNRQ